MVNSTTRRRWLFSALTGTLSAGTLAAAGGCGSILFPERVGQPRGGPIDWRVVALNGVGLVFFFVPGVVAFAVDFYNGTIFLPSGSLGSSHSMGKPRGEEVARCEHQLAAEEITEESRLQKLLLPPESVGREQIEQIVSTAAGRPVQLTPGNYQTQSLADIAQFWPTLRTFSDQADA